MKSVPLLLLVSILTIITAADKPFVSDNDHLTMAVLYHQQAPEYAAICYQAYNIASERLQKIVADKGSSKGLAVVMDLDETVLDNSPFEAKCILENSSYPAWWKEWCVLGEAEGVPGSVEFIQLAGKLGVEIIYISNRKEEYRESTKTNLAKLGIPVKSDSLLILKSKENAKEGRRNELSHDIIMFVGDNLGDFAAIFETDDGEERKQQTKAVREKFGKEYIVLPNAMYGDWEQVLYSKNGNTPVLRSTSRYKALKGF